MVLPTEDNTGFSDLKIVFDKSLDVNELKPPIELLYVNFTEMLEAFLHGRKINF